MAWDIRNTSDEIINWDKLHAPTHENGGVDELVLYSDQVEVAELGTADYDDVQDFINQFGHRTDISGFGITDNEDGTVAVASGKGWCKVSNDINAVGRFFNYAGGNSPALDEDVVSYIYLDYNDGSPTIAEDTTFALSRA